MNIERKTPNTVFLLFPYKYSLYLNKFAISL